MVKTKTLSVDDKYLPVHYNTNSNLVDYMRKKNLKGKMKSLPKWHKKPNRPIVKRPIWTKTAYLAKTKKNDLGC